MDIRDVLVKLGPLWPVLLAWLLILLYGVGS